MEQKDFLPKAAQITTGTCFKVIDFLLQELRTKPENALKYYAETGKYVFINESYNKIIVSNISTYAKKTQLYSVFKNSAYYFYEFDRFDHDNVISVNMYGYLSIKNKENDTPKQIIRRLDFLQLSPGNFEVIVDFTRTIEPMGKNTVTSLSPPKGYTYKKDNFVEVLKNVESELSVKNEKVSESEQKVLDKKKEIEAKKAKIEALKKQIAEKEEEVLNVKKPSELLSKLNSLDKKPPAKLVDKTKSLHGPAGKIISGGSNTDLNKLLKSPVPGSNGSISTSPQPQNKKKSQSRDNGDKTKPSSDSSNSSQNSEKKDDKKNIAKVDPVDDDDGSWETVGSNKNNYKDNKRKNGNNHYKNDGGNGSQGFKKNNGNKSGFQNDLNKKPKHKN